MAQKKTVVIPPVRVMRGIEPSFMFTILGELSKRSLFNQGRSAEARVLTLYERKRKSPRSTRRATGTVWLLTMTPISKSPPIRMTDQVGEWNRSLTFEKRWGTAPSNDQAKIVLVRRKNNPTIVTKTHMTSPT